MFTKDSRYAATPNVIVKDGDREVAAVSLRTLEAPSGAPLTVSGADQLDIISERCYRDGARFWHIADANTELDARDILTPVGRTVDVPER